MCENIQTFVAIARAIGVEEHFRWYIDFYAKVSVMRQNTTVKTRRTDVIKRDLAPKFNESFSFKMAADVVDMYSIVISVWQSVSALKGRI